VWWLRCLLDRSGRTGLAAGILKSRRTHHRVEEPRVGMIEALETINVFIESACVGAIFDHASCTLFLADWSGHIIPDECREPINEAFYAVWWDNRHFAKSRPEEGGCVFGNQTDDKQQWWDRNRLTTKLRDKGCAVVCVAAVERNCLACRPGQQYITAALSIHSQGDIRVLAVLMEDVIF
jgi:hypothetical protein